MERHEQIHKTRRQIFFDNFLGGIAWAFGATLGLSIIVAIIGLIVKNVNLVPIVGNFVAGVLNYVLQNNPHLMR